MKQFVFFWIGFFIFSQLSAQQFGGTPSSIHWNQINTDTVRVIFPKGYDDKARRIANVVHYLQKHYSNTIGTSFRKVNIVIQDQSLISNGYVALAPYRSEFYVTPPQNAFELGAVSWTDVLAVHEFRHVQQYSNFNIGVSKVASFILGEQGQALANTAAIPDWFFEGDAVFNETKLTRQGRGSLPLFLSNYQSLYNSHKVYDYQKMRNGSFQNFVPDHYALGYLLVSYGRIKYGNNIWRKITTDAAAYKSLFYPFQGAVKKYMGVTFHSFVTEAMQYYQQQWQGSVNDSMNWLTQTDRHNVINYRYPYQMSDGAILVLKSSYRQLPAFYKIYPDKREEKIGVRDISVEDFFSYKNNRIVFTVDQPDIRWENRDFNELRVLDINTGKETSIAKHTKYFSPDISHDGKQVIAIENKPMTESKVVVMDIAAQVLDSFSTKGLVFSGPKFSTDNQSYYVLARNDKGEMSLIKNRIGNKGLSEDLLPFSNRILGFINVKGDTLLFSLSYLGRDEIWCIIDEKERKGPFRMATYSTGLYQACLQADGSLAASAFTADGFRLGSFIPRWEKIKDTNTVSDLYTGKVYLPSDHTILDSVPQQDFNITKYLKSFQLINLHSFRPYYSQPEYSFTAYGQNVLNTLQTQIAYTYNQNESSNKLGYTGVYGGSFLQPVFGFNQTWHRTGLAQINSRDTIINWNELSGYAGLQLPLNLSGGKEYRYLNIFSTFNIDQVHWTGFAEKLFKSAQFNFINTGFSYSGQIQKAVQQIYPHWAQSVLVQFRSILNTYTAHQFLVNGSLYLPGFSGNHSLVLSGAFQQRDDLLQYLFSNNFPFSRGYTAIDFPQMERLGINYHFPLAYPDMGVGNIVYFQRIRANLFYDVTYGKSLKTGTSYTFRTTGAEVYFDTRWWNQQPISFGIRYSHLLDNQFNGLGSNSSNIWELILPVSLFN